MCVLLLPETRSGRGSHRTRLQAVGSQLTWVLGTTPRSSERATSVLHPSPLQQVHCPAPKFRVKQFATSLVEEAECLSFGLVSGTEEILVCLEALSLISPTL